MINKINQAKIWLGRSFWKNLANLWGVTAMSIFVVDFFSYHSYEMATSSASIIYVGILTIYVGSKEYYRWKATSKFQSKYTGEIFIFIWTIVMLTFVIIAFIANGLFKIPNEFVATYIYILGVYAVSQQSKSFRVMD